MPPQLELTADETVPGRPFTDPAHTQAEEASLRRLLDLQRDRARAWEDGAEGRRRDVLIVETDPDGHRHLLVVPDTRALLAAPSPTVVGFFGRPRADADTALLFELEEELVAGMGEFASRGLLSYYDVELVHGAYGNLILFADGDGPRRWGENETHRRAVEISPANYHHIRLHQGTLSAPLLEAGHLTVTRTRYLDYDGPKPWRATRRFAETG